MKNLLKFLTLIFGITLMLNLSSCGDSDDQSKREKINSLIDKGRDAEENGVYTDALEYNQAIVGIQTEIVSEMLKLEDEKQLEPLAELIEHKITVLEGMKLKNDSDYGLKSTMLDLFSYYLELTQNEYPKVLQISKEMEENQDNDDVMISLYMELVGIQKSIEEGELVLTDKMSAAQKKFAEANGVILEDNPLQDDIDKANAEFESINESI